MTENNPKPTESRAGPSEPAAASSSSPLEALTGLLQGPVKYLKKVFVIRDEPGPVESSLTGAACILFVLALWSVLTAGAPESRIIGPTILPSLWDTLASFKSLWFDRALARSAAWSLGRVLGGFTLAALVGIPLGVLASSFKRIWAFVRPLSVFGRNIPVAALIPLTLIWFGLGETQKVMFIFFAAVAFVFFDSATAVDSVPDSYLDTAYTLGAGYTPRHGAVWGGVLGLAYALFFAGAYLLLVPRAHDPAALAGWIRGLAGASAAGLLVGFILWFPIFSFQVVRKVLLPLGLPDIFNSLRLLFGLAFGYIMLAEVINSEHGLGSIIIMSQRRGPREHIYLSLIIIAVMAFGIDRLALYAQKKLFPYRFGGEG